MFFNDKKKAAGVILSKLKAGGGFSNDSSSGPSPEAAVDHDFAGLHAASEEMVKAVHAHSPADLHKALSSYLELHHSMQPNPSVGSTDK